ncbi:MAG: hypothetical protein AVDCRST_MAG01-01-4718 [uncultured Rubrobacteraceae bacterium]|uniref:Uncharacterized protein n=1 Tax=uncultured Rubrobacteraceae bacterium TaxID=349277 RepID=A0A6J4QQQ4_9ACTN|nr:MAG: hypothetical protein AVDCRST_MAG01-01-4718 [uncultured Rubrobacteraceae bacterium]
MDGGIEQNPAYGTARPFIRAECVSHEGFYTATYSKIDATEGRPRGQ